MKNLTEFCHQNPYPFFQKLRQMGPIQVKINEDYDSDFIWLFANYDDAVKILKLNSGITKSVRDYKSSSNFSPFDLHLLNRDSIDHKRLRQINNYFFSTTYLNNLNSFIEEIASRQIEHCMNKKGPIDLIENYAALIPLHVICQIMGLPLEHLNFYRTWASSIFIDSLKANSDSISKRRESIFESEILFNSLISNSSTFKHEGMFWSMLKQAEQNIITYDEFLGMSLFMLLAGHETTINLIGNGILLLLNNQDQLMHLIEHPEGWDAAIDEILRYESPNQRSTFRIATQSMNISGVDIKKNEQIAVLIGSANRDEKIFSNSDVFNVRRNHNPHLAYGSGSHTCQGQRLASLEAKIALRLIAPHLLNKKIESPTLWKSSTFLRSLENLIVSF